MKPVPGRRAIWFARISAVLHWFEPMIFGLSLAGGMYLTMHQCGDMVLLDRHGGTSGDFARTGVALVVGVTLITASLTFFHRKGRMLRQRLAAAAVAIAFFGIGYARELGSIRPGSFFGLTTLTPSTSFVEDFPARPKVTYQVNRWGLRGASFPEQRPAGVKRVAIVGDSFVFGSGVEDDATISHLLDERLRERFAGATPEVLNLGVPGNNLASHLATLRIAEERLGADVLVLCLTLPNDLSAWDGQSERLEHGRAGAFSLASFLIGYRPAITLWGERHLARELTPAGLAFLEGEVGRFASARSSGVGAGAEADAGAGAAKPLVVFTYSFADPRVNDLLRRIPNVVVVPPVRWADEHYIPDDGHPTSLGNQLFARLIAASFQPEWLAPAPR